MPAFDRNELLSIPAEVEDAADNDDSRYQLRK
jgi:hypothetical protein